MSYCILRTSKVKTIAGVAASAAHTFRERATANANAARTPNNYTTGAGSKSAVVARVQERLAAVPTVRKNAVVAVEYFVGASPEFFEQADRDQMERYFEDAHRFLVERHGAENVVNFTVHLDEKTPHATSMVVPIDPKGRLSAAHFLDGRERLSALQSDFWAVCGKPHGLERGVEGSTAKHQTISQFYARLNQPAAPPQTQIPRVRPPTIGERITESLGWSTEHSRQVAAAEAARRKRAEEIRQRTAHLEARSRQLDVMEATERGRRNDLRALRAQSVRVREIGLVAVLERLGCTQTAKDKNNWTTPVGRVTVEGEKFFCHDTSKGGGGAIDLVMQVEQVDYKSAVQRLVGEFGLEATTSAAAAAVKRSVQAAAEAPPEMFKPPQSVDSTWPRVRRYLTEVRRISARLVDELHQAGKVYSDKFSNVVFALGQGEISGVELRGTGEKPFHGVRGEKSPFVLPERPGAPHRVLFTESAIDSMSLRELGFEGRIVSLAGNAPKVAARLAQEARDQGWTVVAAFDNDKAGDIQAAALGEAERLRPRLKDWNADLVELREGKLRTTPEQGQDPQQDHHDRERARR